MNENAFGIAGAVEDGVEEHSAFRVIRRDGKLYVTSSDHAVFNAMCSAVPADSPRETRDYSHEFALDDLAERRSGLMEWNRYRDDYDVHDLLSWLDMATVASDAKRVARIETGEIAYSEISFAFRPGMEVYAAGRRSFGGILRKVRRQVSMMFDFYDLEIEVISGVPSQGPTNVRVSARIWAFDGFRSIHSLEVRPLLPEVKASLEKRGAKFREFASGASFAAYEGALVVPSWFGETQFRADGRVMVDAASMSRFASDRHQILMNELRGEDGRSIDDSDDGQTGGSRIRDEDLWRCMPTLPAFSFAAKMWGEVFVDHMSTIRYREDAFEKLVLDEDLKRMILALVKHSGQAFSDLIDNKSGGCIMLLHGPPGGGKTLTAESVAEVLHRPLYSVSVGELGTNPDALEARLREILDMAQRWNAVLLLDEADIFLEARDERDVVRNAMVGVFLRLLEYHDGVMFLTTNRVKNFDVAFHSRISIAIAYPSMGATKREKVWNNLLDAAGVNGIEACQYSDAQINGRQIKNVLRLAQTLAVSEGTEVEEQHIDLVLKHLTAFQREITA